jgi:hypothetical protein
MNMESNHAVVGALIFIAMIVLANLAMYAIARGATKGGGSDWMSALRKGLSKPMDSEASRSMNELRQKMEELQKNEKKEE